MKKRYLYTIVFMLLLSAFFSAVVSFAEIMYRDKIELNEINRKNKSILLAAQVDISAIEDINDFFQKNIKENTGQGDLYYQYYKNDKIIAAIYPFSGPGLWGTIKGYISVSPDHKEIIGLDFTDHNETPGLGGRIDEDWFKNQFRNIKITKASKLNFNENEDLDAISGATNTSTAVLEILNSLIEIDFGGEHPDE
jgi:Na+-transporting NADH:ubiquinone oxidoreductase subunit C